LERSRLCSTPLLLFSWPTWIPAWLCEEATIKQTRWEKLRSQGFHSLSNEERELCLWPCVGRVLVCLVAHLSERVNLLSAYVPMSQRQSSQISAQ
jgi:hypothetical protein